MVDSKVNLPVNFKGSQPQIQRIKKQDEDDHWISEEELYTEGSSDEENPSNSSKKHSSKGRKTNVRNYTSPSSNVRSSRLSDKGHSSDKAMESNAVSEGIEQSDISWRPKRGSIKLPGVDLSEISKSSDVQQQQ